MTSQEFSHLLTPHNPITDFKPAPIKFGVYNLSLSIGLVNGRISAVDLSDYFGKAEWEELSTAEQHDWLDSFAQAWADEVTSLGWMLVNEA
jgi:hypothetical protein